MVVAHAAGSLADAYNVDFIDVLPSGMNFVGGQFVTGYVPTSTNFGTSSTVRYDHFPLGATTMFTIDARLDSSYIDSVSMTNTGVVRWT